MGSGTRTGFVCSIAATVLLVARPGVGHAASVPSDQYDPRRDPNYSRQAWLTAPIPWEAVLALAREFEGRTYQIMDRRQPSSQFAAPQPWHYVQETPSPWATSSVSGAAGYGGPYGGPFYGYDPWFSGWRETSPRIPWWSLVPFTTKHHQHHRHQKGTSHHH